MEIQDLTDLYYDRYFCCLKDWSDEMVEAGTHKKQWFSRMRNQGLRVKSAVEISNACGMIQYLPAEKSTNDGKHPYFMHCIWVHGYKQGIRNYQGRGIGTALLHAAEEDIRSMEMSGVAAWRVAFLFWMKASWFKKHGYRSCDRDGIAQLVWKPFVEGPSAPKWIKAKRKPSSTEGKVSVTSFVNGWCQAQNIVHERARRATEEIGEPVLYREIDTSDRIVFEEWSISDALYIDRNKVNIGPPPSDAKLRRRIEKRVRRIKR